MDIFGNRSFAGRKRAASKIAISIKIVFSKFIFQLIGALKIQFQSGLNGRGQYKRGFGRPTSDSDIDSDMNLDIAMENLTYMTVTVLDSSRRCMKISSFIKNILLVNVTCYVNKIWRQWHFSYRLFSGRI